MKVAIVAPWFSDTIAGGAERFAGGIARCLQDAGCSVEILTTCGKDSFWDWGTDFYKPGIYAVGDLSVRRFSLRKRNKLLYEELLGQLINKKELKYTEEMQLLLETVNSDELNAFIFERASEYLFLFIPYLYGTTFWGSRICPAHSFIVPCLHDEDMAYFKSIGHMLQRAAGLLFNTIEEQELAVKLHSVSIEKSVISGGGVEVNYIPNPHSFRAKYNIQDDYYIYVGRQVTGKNVPQLIEYFNRYVKENNPKEKLIFVGKGEEHLIELMKASPNILHIGELSEEEKYDAIGGSVALIQPSLMESFSIVIMESWLCSTPVIVHESCVVTKGHADRSQGGLYYKDYNSFVEIMRKFQDQSLECNDLGIMGKAYVKSEYTWEKTAERILDFFEKSGFSREVLINENIN